MINIHDSNIWIEDTLSTSCELELDELSNKSVLITGCTGLICSAVVDVLCAWNEQHKCKIHIIAACRTVKTAEQRFKKYVNETWFSIIQYDANEDLQFNFNCDYIIHGASNASPDKIIQNPVETMISNFVGIKNLLEYAKRASVKNVLFISSSEVYGNALSDKAKNINDYSGIDLLNSRNSYSIGKCAAETLCISYAAEYGIKTTIVRPGHIYGPTALLNDTRVSQAWCLTAIKAENIIMKSAGTQIRSYCYCLDCATAILTVLLNGETAHAYNISNPESIITINDVATIISSICGVNVVHEMPSMQEKHSFNPMTNSSLNSDTLCKLGWKCSFNAQRGFEHTIKILREIFNARTNKTECMRS